MKTKRKRTVHDNVNRGVYLGDGVYASRDEDGDLQLTTGHHIPAMAANVIYVGRSEEKKLREFIDGETLGDPL